AGDWLLGLYRQWGIEAEKEEYGTWRGWRPGIVHVDLTAPRVQTLEAKLLAWSPGTSRPVEAEVVQIPELRSREEADAWLPSVRGKIVLASVAEPTCREPQSIERLARPETVARLQQERQARHASWNQRLQALGESPHRRLEEAGALA